MTARCTDFLRLSGNRIIEINVYLQLRSTYHQLHAGTVVPLCHKDDVKSQWKNLNFDPCYPKQVNRWSPKFPWVITSRIHAAVQNVIMMR